MDLVKMTHSWLRALYLLGLFIFTSCNVPPPSFVELSAPRGSVDALGPYAFSAKVNGAVDEVQVFWIAVTPDSENQRPTQSDFGSANRLTLNLNNGLWQGELAGGLRVAQYYYFFEAVGPGGRSQEPRGGIDRFEVNALNESCVVDSDCLNDEICHRQELYCLLPPNPCREDAHCPRDRVCNLENGQCRFSDTICELDTDCAEGQSCESGVCQDIIEPPPPPPPECDPTCLENEVCVDGICVSEVSRCTADGQCSEGEACDLSTGLCQVGNRGTFCAPCDASQIEASGADFGGCGVGFGCSAFTAGCRPTCNSRGLGEAECDEGSQCQEGLCINANNQELLGMCGATQCTSHAECASGRCDRGRCTEVQFCDEDNDCLDAACAAGVCRVLNNCDVLSCDQDQLCLGGQCQQIDRSRQCEPCQGDADCSALSHCLADESGQGYCYTMCERDQNCAEGELCYLQGQAVGYCATEGSLSCESEPESCATDNFEPNDALNDASEILIIPFVPLRVEGILCPLDDDFYKFQANSSTNYTVQIFTQTPSEFYLYNEAGEEIAYYPNFFPIAEGTSLELSGTHYLKIQGISNGSTGAYQIDINVEDPIISCDDDDNLEENDSIQQSYPIGSGAELTLALCPADADWFMVRGRAGELWSISLFLRPFDGEVQLSVGRQQDYEAGTALSWFYESDGQQTAEFTMQNTEPYYLSLVCNNCTESIRYLLGLSR